jgi:Flp pilus assembly protein TadG
VSFAALRQRSNRISARFGGDPVPLARRLRGESGQGAIEFALVLPLIAALLFVCVLFGKALYVYLQVTHSANEGARLAAVNQPSSTGLGAFLTSEGALPAGASIAICYPTGSRAVGQPVQVDVYTSSTWVPFASFPGNQIKAAATMRIEQDTTNNANLAPTTGFGANGTCST